MSAAANLFPLLWVLAFLSPVVAIFFAARFYALHCRRRPEAGRHFPIVAYVLVLLVGAIVAFPFGAFFGISQACPGAGNLCGLFGFFVAGPFASSLVVFLVGGLIALLPADEAAPIPVDEAPLHPKTRWYRKLWHGEYSLAYSFWGFFILGTVVGMILGMNPIFLFFPARLVFQPVFLGYQIIAGVGVWRSTNALDGAAGRGSPSATPAGSIKIIAAKTAVVLLVAIHVILLLRTLNMLVSYSSL